MNAGAAPAEEGVAAQTYRFVAVMTLAGSKWRFEDVRMYVVQEPTAPAKKEAPKPAAPEAPAPAKS